MLETWLKTTHTKLIQVNGQRKYGGPPEGEKLLLLTENTLAQIYSATIQRKVANTRGCNRSDAKLFHLSFLQYTVQVSYFLLKRLLLLQLILKRQSCAMIKLGGKGCINTHLKQNTVLEKVISPSH